MPAFNSKYHVGIDAKGYILSHARGGQFYYQKKLAPAFVNKFGSGDSSYRDSTFWQFWATTNWRNGAKQLRLDDPGKFWKSENVNVTQLDELTLSRALTLMGQTAAGNKNNAIAAWRSSQSWYNANYGYRQQLTITAPASQQVPSGHPVKITIDTAALQTASKVRSDRNDWRIVYFNGSTHVDLTRDYIGTTTTFFALQAAIAAGQSDSNYYVYYGYSSESTSKQPSTEADWNAVYGFFGTTPDSNSKSIWHFREGSGTSINDDSSSSNTLTLNGTHAWSTDGKFGRYDTQTRANNTSMTAGTSTDFDLSSMTLEGWFNFPSLSTYHDLFYRKKSGGTNEELAYSLYYAHSDSGTDQGIHFRTCNASGSQDDLVYTWSPSVNTWYHIAATYDGTTKKIFVNGTEVASKTWTDGVIASEGSFYVGATDRSADNNRKANVRSHHLRVSNIARASFPYVLSSEPSLSNGNETTTQPPSSSFDLYVGGSDGKIYKHDGTSTFSEQFDVRRVVWFESGTDTNVTIGDIGGTESAAAQSFQLAAAQTIKSLELYMKKANGTPGDITVRIETNNAGVPSGTLAHANAATTITAFSTTSYAWKEAIFASTFQLSASTTYWIVVKIAAGANDNNYEWAADSSSPSYSDGNAAISTNGGTSYTAETGRDQYFRVKGETASINDMLVSSVGGTLKMLIATGDISGQTNGNARLFSYDGTNYALEKTFATSTESQITKLAEFNGKLYAGVGPQARIYEGTNPSTWTLSKDIDTPQKPGYIYALKEYNGKLYAGGGSPEFLYDKHYNGFWYVYDTNAWLSLYPFDFTELRSFEFYDAFLFGNTYHGHIYVFDTATLNPLFNFRDGFGYNVTVHAAQLYDDKIYFFLYPQETTNETNVGIWLFDRHGLSLAHTLSGVTGFRCAAVVNNLLVIGTGDDGNVYKLDLTKYSSQGWLQSSYFDANLPSINKLFNSLTIQHDALEEGHSIVIYYKFKESDSWTTLGTSNTVGETEKTINFPSATYGKKISLKVELNTTDDSVTPKVKEYVLQYSLLPTRKWMWTMKIIAKKTLKLVDGTTETYTPTEIRTNIETSQNSNKLITFVDIDGTSYTVLFSEIDQASWVINQNDVNEDEIAITLIEA